MKAYRITMVVVDHEDMGSEAVSDLLAANRYVNPEVTKIEEADIGDWHDGHPLNLRGADMDEPFDGPPEPEVTIGADTSLLVVPEKGDPHRLLSKDVHWLETPLSWLETPMGRALSLVDNGEPHPKSIQHAENVLAQHEGREPMTLGGTCADAANIAAGLEDPMYGDTHLEQIAAYYWVKDAAFIEAARVALPKLLARVRELEGAEEDRHLERMADATYHECMEEG